MKRRDDVHHVADVRAAALVASVLMVACVGELGRIDDGAPSEPDQPITGRGPTTGVPVAFDGTPSRLRRLSRDELLTSLRLLTGDAPDRDDLPEDPRDLHAPVLNTGVGFVATEIDRLHAVLSRFAAKVAPKVRASAGCARQPSAPACYATWARQIADQALRRPITAEEATALEAIVSEADGTEPTDDAAVEAVLAAVIQSPSFLYRTTLGVADVDGGDSRRLSGREIANRLAFLVTQGPPDPALRAAEDRLQDPEERRRHFRRLVTTNEGRQAIATMVLEWLGANEARPSQKSAKHLSGLPGDVDVVMRDSAVQTIVSVLEGSPTLSEIMTTKTYLTSPAVAAITAVTDGYGDDEATGRRGLLMHPFVIAGHTKEDGASPFQIGSFLKEGLLCESVGEPPPNAAELARQAPPAGLTLREDLEYRTSAAPTCTNCHEQFAGLGYAFLPFDPVGRWRPQDPVGKSWDLGATVATTSGPTLRFRSPSELTEVLAGHPQFIGCFAQTAVKWTLGRRLVREDQRLLAEADRVATASGGDIVAIFEAIATHPDFTTIVGRK
jgi:hypothetical protein